MAVSQCAEKLSRAMGLEHVKDQEGQKAFANIIRRASVKNGQLVMKWDDQNAERPFMEVSRQIDGTWFLGQLLAVETRHG